ncbi:Clp protease N-terminal domain-containing protein [Motilibacter deserti]|uniref:Clp protease n=1 Tax=Motilibacter deserti TaxID=2714956 RepID=A0ABX0GS19_9ACTN|nr:Clp protease N-terminal domain-containing protein [Motilibacter deserti]NHC13678.1 Clp protease [Motilibacter deserti]
MSFRDKAADVRTVNALLTGAEQEALAAGDDLPGVEHLVLAALGLPDGTAADVLVGFGVSDASLRAALARVHADALVSVGVDGSVREPDVAAGRRVGPRGFRATATADQAFRAATALKQSSGADRLLGAHVVAAACEQERGTFPRVLQALGVDRAALRAACEEKLARQARG